MSERLRVNPIACEAHGMCAELLPERITLDEWGYPLVDGARWRAPSASTRVARSPSARPSPCSSSAARTSRATPAGRPARR